VGWRLLESERGYLDLLGGVRFNQFYQRMTTQPNDEVIDQTVYALAAATGPTVASRARACAHRLAGEGCHLAHPPLDGGDAERTPLIFPAHPLFPRVTVCDKSQFRNEIICAGTTIYCVLTPQIVSFAHVRTGSTPLASSGIRDHFAVV
jgi:hypothetical protein